MTATRSGRKPPSQTTCVSADCRQASRYSCGKSALRLRHVSLRFRSIAPAPDQQSRLALTKDLRPRLSLRRRGLPLRRAMGIRDLVGVAGDEIVVMVDLGRRLQRLVRVGRAVLIGEHAAQDRTVAQRERGPFSRD